MKSQIATTIEQSKRLLNAGFRRDSADMQYTYHAYDDRYFLNVAYDDSQLFAAYPAWSLSKLIELAGKKETVVWIPEIAPQLGDVGDYIERLVHFLELPDVKILPGLHQK